MFLQCECYLVVVVISTHASHKVDSYCTERPGVKNGVRLYFNSIIVLSC
jgi:hypothetical protein